MAKETKDLKSVFALRKAKEGEKEKATVKEVKNDLTAFVARFGQEKIDQWKAQFPGRELIAIAVGSQLAILRPPTAEDLGDYMTAIANSGMSKAVAMVVEQLWLDGDYSLIEEEDSFIAVFLQVNNLLEGKKAEFFRF